MCRCSSSTICATSGGRRPATQPGTTTSIRAERGAWACSVREGCPGRAACPLRSGRKTDHPCARAPDRGPLRRLRPFCVRGRGSGSGCGPMHSVRSRCRTRRLAGPGSDRSPGGGARGLARLLRCRTATTDAVCTEGALRADLFGTVYGGIFIMLIFATKLPTVMNSL